MIYFLFDIDGTLLLSGGAGRVAMHRAMQDMFGIGELHRLAVHGRTDRAIIIDLFAAHQLPLDESTYLEFTNRYHAELENCIAGCPGKLLDGVSELLDRLSRVSDVAMGLLTGNSREGAMTKVRHFGIDRHFGYGGYGHTHACRNDVAREALSECRRWAAPCEVREDQIWIVGDTINDIRCARAIGAKVIAVATGGNSRVELERGTPDLMLDDLNSHEAFFDLCNRGKLG